MLLCLMGVTPSSPRRGYPGDGVPPPIIQTWDGVPRIQNWDGVPQSRPDMGYLYPDLGWGAPSRPGMDTPIQTWDAIPQSILGMGYPHPDLGWGTPHPDLRCHNPIHSWDGVPHPRSEIGYPLSKPEMGYPLIQTWDGVPPVQTWDGVTPSLSRAGCWNPHPDLGWDTPPPHPHLEWDPPPPILRMRAVITTTQKINVIIQLTI